MTLKDSMNEIASRRRSSHSNVCMRISRNRVGLTSCAYIFILLAVVCTTAIQPTYAQEGTPGKPPPELIKQLEALEADGKWDEAVVMVDKLLHEYPDWVEGYLKKCSIYGSYGNFVLTNEEEQFEAYDTARGACTQAINSGRLNQADLFTAYFLRGQIFYFIRQYDQALLDFDVAKLYSPEDGSIYSWLSYVYLDLGDLEAALEEAYKWVEYGPNREDAILFVINAVSRSGIKTQIEVATTVIDRSPDKMYIGYLWRCSLYAAYDPAGNVIEDCTTAIELDDRYLAPYYYRAAGEYDAGHLAEAAADLEIALERIPQYPAPSYFNVYDFLGGVYWGMEEYEQAEAMFTQGILYAPSPESLAREHIYRAVMRLVMDKKGGIIEDLDAAFAQGSTDVGFLQTLALMYMQMDDLSAGIKVVNRAIEIAPEEGRLWMIRALAHYLGRQDDQAIEDLRQGAELMGFQNIQLVINFIRGANLHGVIGNLFRTVWNSDILGDELVSSLLEQLNPADRKLMENLLGY